MMPQSRAVCKRTASKNAILQAFSFRIWSKEVFYLANYLVLKRRSAENKEVTVFASSLVAFVMRINLYQGLMPGTSKMLWHRSGVVHLAIYSIRAWSSGIR